MIIKIIKNQACISNNSSLHRKNQVVANRCEPRSTRNSCICRAKGKSVFAKSRRLILQNITWWANQCTISIEWVSWLCVSYGGTFPTECILNWRYYDYGAEFLRFHAFHAFAMLYCYSHANAVIVLHLLSLLLCNFTHLTSPLNPETWLVKKWFWSLGTKAELLLILVEKW